MKILKILLKNKKKNTIREGMKNILKIVVEYV